MQNPEPRFYPSYRMKIDFVQWRALPPGERNRRGFAFSNQIRQFLFERIQEIHPNWSDRQRKLMFFKLSYRGEHFETFAKAQIKRGHLTEAEVEAVRAVPIPVERADALRYAGISHPDLDTDQIIWP